ncbi:hypothetical protein EDD18DRAFT_1109849 [Armillaria luteobubalina]|uniref:Uncharacterized protein n=1 Tax=Armillaria luteobubalina TaxID=153913 RepID=A0AA39PSZ5_9AGAR|nr:hypothetical protein EDD18DRAFT_1109849 [Armillaria luteobubalina]
MLGDGAMDVAEAEETIMDDHVDNKTYALELAVHGTDILLQDLVTPGVRVISSDGWVNVLWWAVVCPNRASAADAVKEVTKGYGSCGVEEGRRSEDGKSWDTRTALDTTGAAGGFVAAREVSRKVLNIGSGSKVEAGSNCGGCLWSCHFIRLRPSTHFTECRNPRFGVTMSEGDAGPVCNCSLEECSGITDVCIVEGTIDQKPQYVEGGLLLEAKNSPILGGDQVSIDGRGNGTLPPHPLPPRQNIYAPIPSPSQEYIVHNYRERDVDQLQLPFPKMLFNIFNTMLTEMELNITTIREHVRIEACLEELMPTLQSSLGHRFTDTNELDLVVYDLIDLGAKNNVAALFSIERRLLGVVSWATTGTVATFKTCMTLLHPAPYQVTGTNGTPDSLFVHDPFMNTEIALPMGLVVQL